MKTENYEAVWFTAKQKEQYETLRKKGYTSMEFKDFVKKSFHESLDKINIEKIAFKQTQTIILEE